MSEKTPNACETCGVAPRPFDSVLYGSDGGPSRLLCGRCFNLEAARRGGLVDFEHIDFEPLTMSGRRQSAWPVVLPHQGMLPGRWLSFSAFLFTQGRRVAVWVDSPTAQTSKLKWQHLMVSGQRVFLSCLEVFISMVVWQAKRVRP